MNKHKGKKKIAHDLAVTFIDLCFETFASNDRFRYFSVVFLFSGDCEEYLFFFSYNIEYYEFR